MNTALLFLQHNEGQHSPYRRAAGINNVRILTATVIKVASFDPYCLLVVPHHRLSSYGQRAFSVAGPAIWNWLPDSLREPDISRLLQALTEDVFIFSLLVYIVH